VVFPAGTVGQPTRVPKRPLDWNIPCALALPEEIFPRPSELSQNPGLAGGLLEAVGEQLPAILVRSVP